MRQKNCSFNIFSSCYEVGKNMSKININTQSQTSFNHKKSTKVSLKRNVRHSLKQEFSSGVIALKKMNKQSEPPQNDIRIFLKQRNRKENKTALMDISLQEFNSPILNKLAIQKAQSIPISKKQNIKIQFRYGFKNPLLKEVNSHIGNNIKNVAKIQSKTSQIGIKQPQLLNKENFISSLEEYKQSLVSLSFQPESVHQKFQESQVMVNYFNPDSAKAVQLEKYIKIDRYIF